MGIIFEIMIKLVLKLLYMYLDIYINIIFIRIKKFKVFLYKNIEYLF